MFNFQFQYLTENLYGCCICAYLFSTDESFCQIISSWNNCYDFVHFITLIYNIFIHHKALWEILHCNKIISEVTKYCSLIKVMKYWKIQLPVTFFFASDIWAQISYGNFSSSRTIEWFWINVWGNPKLCIMKVCLSTFTVKVKINIFVGKFYCCFSPKNWLLPKFKVLEARPHFI